MKALLTLSGADAPRALAEIEVLLEELREAGAVVASEIIVLRERPHDECSWLRTHA